MNKFWTPQCSVWLGISIAFQGMYYWYQVILWFPLSPVFQLILYQLPKTCNKNSLSVQFLGLPINIMYWLWKKKKFHFRHIIWKTLHSACLKWISIYSKKKLLHLNLVCSFCLFVLQAQFQACQFYAFLANDRIIPTILKRVGCRSPLIHSFSTASTNTKCIFSEVLSLIFWIPRSPPSLILIYRNYQPIGMWLAKVANHIDCTLFLSFFFPFFNFQLGHFSRGKFWFYNPVFFFSFCPSYSHHLQ